MWKALTHMRGRGGHSASASASAWVFGRSASPPPHAAQGFRVPSRPVLVLWGSAHTLPRSGTAEPGSVTEVKGSLRLCVLAEEGERNVPSHPGSRAADINCRHSLSETRCDLRFPELSTACSMRCWGPTAPSLWGCPPHSVEPLPGWVLDPQGQGGTEGSQVVASPGRVLAIAPVVGLTTAEAAFTSLDKSGLRVASFFLTVQLRASIFV